MDRLIQRTEPRRFSLDTTLSTASRSEARGTTRWWEVIYGCASIWSDETEARGWILLSSCIMESPNGSDTKPQSHHPHPQVEKKRLNRAPSPARPVLKDVHSRTAKPIVPKSPKFNKQQTSSTPVTPHSRVPRRAVPGAKDKPASAPAKSKPSATKKAVKVTQHAASEPKPACKAVDTAAPQIPKSKGRLAPIRVPTARGVCQTDSSSDLSDCPSEPLSDEQRLVQAASSDAESGSGSGSSEQVVGVRVRALGAGGSQASPAPGAHGDQCKAEKDAQFKTGGKEMAPEEMLREIEDLRSENDYLKVSPHSQM